MTEATEAERGEEGSPLFSCLFLLSFPESVRMPLNGDKAGGGERGEIRLRHLPGLAITFLNLFFSIVPYENETSTPTPC